MENVSHGSADDEALLDALRDVAAYHVQHDDYVETLVDTKHDPINAPDRLAELTKILQALAVLCRGQREGAKWLFHSQAFLDVAGSDAYIDLENGDFWTLAAVGDFLSLLAKYKDDPVALYRETFDYPPAGACLFCS